MKKSNIPIMVTLFLAFLAFSTKITYGDYPTWSPINLNNDGKDDLLFFNQNDKIHYGLLNSKTDCMCPKDVMWDMPRNYKVGDFNGDGFQDIITYNKGFFSVFTNNKDGKMQAHIDIWQINAPRNWHVGNFNGDERDEIVVYDPDIKGGSFRVYFNSGLSNKLENYAVWEVSSGTEWLIGDFNGDKKDELIRYLGEKEEFEVYENTGRFDQLKRYAYWREIKANIGLWKVGDFNGDMRDEIIRYNYENSDGVFDVYMNVGPIQVKEYAVWEIDANQGWSIGNFDGVGGDELVRYVSDPKHSLRYFDVFKNVGPGVKLDPYAKWQIQRPSNLRSSDVSKLRNDSELNYSDIDERRQLLLDESFVSYGDGVRVQPHQPCKCAMRNEFPCLRGTVPKREVGDLRLYCYRSDQTTLDVYRSSDGMTWNFSNTAFNGDALAVFYDPIRALWVASVWKERVTPVTVDTPETDRRRTCGDCTQCSHPERGVYEYTSRDGLGGWVKSGGRIFEAPADPVCGPDDTSYFYFDHQLQKYVATLKLWQRNLPPNYGDCKQSNNSRIRGQMESNDLVNWSSARVTLPIEIDGPNPDPLGYQHYGSTHFPYQNAWLGFIRTMSTRSGDWLDVGYMDTQLVYSRDGTEWRRANAKQSFIPNGGLGDFDNAVLDVSRSAPIESGNHLLIYYTGRGKIHGGYQPYPGRITACPNADNLTEGGGSFLGVARIRKDGFVSIDAEGSMGFFATHPLRFSGSNLLINADIETSDGSIAVELRDSNGVPIPGFERSSSKLTKMSDIEYRVNWQANVDMSSLDKSKHYEIVFFLKHASVYSYAVN